MGTFDARDVSSGFLAGYLAGMARRIGPLTDDDKAVLDEIDERLMKLWHMEEAAKYDAS